MNYIPKASGALLVLITVHRPLNMLGLLAGLFNLAFTACANQTVQLELYIPETDGALHSNGQGPCDVPEGSAGRGSYQVRGLCLIIKQFFALLIKRLHHATRSYKDFFAQVSLL